MRPPKLAIELLSIPVLRYLSASKSVSYTRPIAALAALGVVLAVAGSSARAEEDRPQASDDRARQDQAASKISDEDQLLLDMAQGEVIQVWAERPDKPFDRDTSIRLTGAELTERGVTNLAQALELVPEINVRFAGRGGRILDVRGARKGSIKVIVDGIPVDDPYYGTFDVSSIPVTDIVQIRVSSSPSSPLDGVGGPGGVIEVHTRDAIGARRLDTRMVASSRPEGLVSATGRSQLSDHWAVRPSVAASLGSFEFNLLQKRIDESRHDINGATRIEYRRGKRRLVTDISVQNRSFVVPPKTIDVAEMPPADLVFDHIRLIRGENAARVGVVADDHIGEWRVQGNAYGQILTRESLVYDDTDMDSAYGEASAFDNYESENIARTEDLFATRLGAGILANRSLRKRFQLIGAALFLTESADVTDTNFLSNNTSGRETAGRSTIAHVSTGVQWEDGPLRVDSAVGLAAPIGVDAGLWPEFKVAAWYRAIPGVLFKATGARKGRLPTLRERYSFNGNESLDPEQAWFGEVAVVLDPSDWVRFESAAFVRDTNGQIRQGFDDGQIRLINLGDLTIRGIDTQLAIAPKAALSGGVSWSHINPTLIEGEEPLDFLPRHRATVWLTARRGERMGGTARLRFTGEQEDQGVTLPTRSLVELSAYAEIKAGILANLRVENLLDERYALRAGVESPGRIVTLSLQGGWE